MSLYPVSRIIPHWKRFCVSVLALSGMVSVAQAQHDSHRLHVAVLQTDNFVVGPGAKPSGFFRWESDTTWTHMGWKKSRHNGISYRNDAPETIFLACGNGVFRTTDGGESWKIVTGWEITEIQDVAVDTEATSTVYIATAYGIWRSSDNGDTWSATNNGVAEMSRYFQTIHADYSRGGHVLAGGEAGMVRTTTGGESWTFVGPSVPVRDIQQSVSDPELWIAGTEDHGVWISRDGGAQWEQATGAIASHTMYAVAIDPQNPSRMAAGGYQNGVFISNDGGASWVQTTSGLKIRNVHAVIFDRDGSGRVWAGTVGSGVYYSDNNGRQWTYAGLAGSEIWDMEYIGGQP